MSQKTHPVGFRIGINSKSVTPAYSLSDIHGLSSRWTTSNNSNVSNYADLSHRDRLIKKVVEEFIEEDGYLVNKVVVHRSHSYTGIYVDAFKLQEPCYYHISQLQSSVPKVLSKKVQYSSDMTVLQNNISRNIELYTPVLIQFVTLNSTNSTNTARSMNNHASLSSNLGEIDLASAISVLTKKSIPCSSLLAKLISLNMSFGGRRERQTLRIVLKLLGSKKSLFSPTQNLKGYLIKFKGRIGGSERSRTIRYRSGTMPRHTVSEGIDYGYSEVNTVSGKVSVTVLCHF